MTTCPTCSEPLADDPSSYYHRKACEARVLRARIEAGDDSPEVRAQLERAQYVGD